MHRKINISCVYRTHVGDYVRINNGPGPYEEHQPPCAARERIRVHTYCRSWWRPGIIEPASVASESEIMTVRLRNNHEIDVN